MGNRWGTHFGDLICFAGRYYYIYIIYAYIMYTTPND